MDHEPGQAVRDLIRAARRVATGEDGAADALRALFDSPTSAEAIEKGDKEIRSEVGDDLWSELGFSLRSLEEGPPGVDQGPDAHERLRARAKRIVEALRAHLAEMEIVIDAAPYPGRKKDRRLRRRDI